MFSQKIEAIVLTIPLIFLIGVSFSYWRNFGKEQKREVGKKDIAYNNIYLTLVGIGYFGIWVIWISGIIFLLLEKLPAAPVQLSTAFMLLIFQIIGLVLLYAGSLFFGWTLYSSGKYLRPSISGIHSDHKLIRTGPLGIVRHPYYMSYIVMLTGLGLSLSTWWAALFLACLMLGIKPSAAAEEKELAVRFAKEYEEYKQQTGCFFPKL